MLRFAQSRGMYGLCWQSYRGCKVEGRMCTTLRKFLVGSTPRAGGFSANHSLDACSPAGAYLIDTSIAAAPKFPNSDLVGHLLLVVWPMLAMPSGFDPSIVLHENHAGTTLEPLHGPAPPAPHRQRCNHHQSLLLWRRFKFFEPLPSNSVGSPRATPLIPSACISS